MQRKDLPNTQPKEISRLKECTHKLYNAAARQTKETQEGHRHSNDVKSDQLCMGFQKHGDFIATSIHDEFVKRICKLEDTFDEEKKEYELKIENLSDRNNILENHVKELEKILNTTNARDKLDITGFERPETGEQLLTSDMSTQTEDCPKCAELDDQRFRLVEKIEKLQIDRDGIENHAKQLKADNDDLRIRLSKLAGDKLTDNNPVITDLSDNNRPTKLGEFYSELYDNEWTDAYDALLKAGYTDDETITILNRTLKHVMTYCEANADKLVMGLPDTISKLFEENDSSFLKMHSFGPCQAYNVCDIWSPKVNVNEKRSEIKNPKQVTIEENATVDIRDTVKRFTKEISAEIVPLVKMGYLKATKWNDNCIEDLKPFILKCIYLCWMMTVQSPRMVFHGHPTERSDVPFDKGLYKEYITSGPVVKYVVWPALLLQKDGPLVCKGVAEGMQPKSGEIYV
ncbi:uncharacterized protein LOC132755035 isoform X2 [Ruditapes philippinarum]|uniref:uncharacterized protein LOC132755035 isoform X2 n=1 Tax=Ruditapes philippinarum TaxID=129788 RepID=UPI00295B15EF|nr:uncharacterized protein LOC132755035 isoform X2 [Ruditapes philippinarum]